MNILEKIKEDLINAMKSHDEVGKMTLRTLIAEIKAEAVNANIDRENISDEVSLKVLEKSAKKHEESIHLYESSGRSDLANSEKKELEIIKKYLPEDLSDEELKSIVEKVKKENPTVQGMALMGRIMPHVRGRANPDKIKELL